MFEGSMNPTFDVKSFVKDYCEGVKDRDLLVKHGLGAKELVGMVKKLINEGVISKEAYFERSRKLEEREARQERDFLKSLFHCPVCSHIQPIPFTVCPSCGTNIEEYRQKEEPEPEEAPIADSSPPVAPESIHEPESYHSPGAPEQMAAPTSPAPALAVPDEEEAIPEYLLDKIGIMIDDLSLEEGISEQYRSAEYRVTEIIRNGSLDVIFKAEDETDTAPALLLRQFHFGVLKAPEDEFLRTVLAYQSGMDDSNILPVLGFADLDGDRALIYPYFPKTLETIARKHPEGLPLDTLTKFLRQIFNAIGYSHMHRGRDGVVRRLPHMYLSLSAFVVNEEEDRIRLDGCGIWKSLVETRGHKPHLWEEPGVDLSALAPEAFVIGSKFVNGFSADMYALGALLYRLTTGKAAFSASTVEEYNFAHLRTFPVPPKVHRYTVPAWLDRMILKALEKDRVKRWRSATQMELTIGKDFHD
jgi:serine/threonine protein kinase